MTEKELKELEKIARENGYDDELLTKIKNTNEIKFSTKH